MAWPIAVCDDPPALHLVPVYVQPPDGPAADAAPGPAPDASPPPRESDGTPVEGHALSNAEWGAFLAWIVRLRVCNAVNAETIQEINKALGLAE